MKSKIINYNKIDPNYWYNIADVARLGQKGIFPIKNKIHMKILIREKKIKAIDVGTKKRNSFRILGSALLEFINTYK